MNMHVQVRPVSKNVVVDVDRECNPATKTIMPFTDFTLLTIN